MGWLLLVVIIAFLVIVFIGMRRVLLVFSGSRLLRICGATLFVANVFVALTAGLGGITLAAGIDKFPAGWLAGTAFSSYLIPGLILAVVVGGSATGAALATLRSRGTGALFSMLAGAIMLGWLAGERLILPPAAFPPQFWWLEAIYVAAGLLMAAPAVIIRWVDHGRRSQHSWVCLLLLPLFAASASAASHPIEYQLDLRQSASHRVEVVMTVEQASPATEFQFPAWNNLYQIRDFAQDITELGADCDGSKEQLARVDLDTWRSEAKPCQKLSLHYAVFVMGAPPFSSSVDSQHAFLNFATLLFYLPKERGRAVHVKLLVPAEWKVASLLEEDVDGFHAANYDLLGDSPAEAGQFQDYSFSEGGATYRVVVHADPKGYSADRLLASLRKITATETGIMRDVPFSRYTFILHFMEQGSGGMEHRNGTAITVRAAQLRDHWEGLEGVAAHEFFHLWNVKRIRPQLLEPIDYVHGNDTRDLWFCEGVTSTYGELVLVRAGLISRPAFYARLGSEITALQSRPARLFESVEESGLEAWFEKYRDYYRPERSISYYNKGELLGFLLDLGLRHATDNAAGLDDVMRRMNEEFGRPGRFYTEEDLQRVIGQVAPAFQDLGTFFADYVRGTRELDYVTYLGYAGLELKSEERGSPRLGFDASLDPAGGVRVDYVEPRSGAAQAGLLRGDLLESMNGQALHDSPNNLLPQLNPGQDMKFEVQRGGSALTVTYKLDSNPEAAYRVKEIPHPSPEQLRVRQGWLEGNTTASPK